MNRIEKSMMEKSMTKKSMTEKNMIEKSMTEMNIMEKSMTEKSKIDKNMIVKKVFIKTTVMLAAVFLFMRAGQKSVYALYSTPADYTEIDGNTTVLQNYYITLHYETNGVRKTSTKKMHLMLKGADSITIKTPTPKGCDLCRYKQYMSGLYSISTFLEKSDGRVINGNGMEIGSLSSETLDPDNDYVCVQIVMTPGELCSACNRHAGDLLMIEPEAGTPTVVVRKKLVDITKQPSAAVASHGENASFDIDVGKYIDPEGNPMNAFNWAVKKGDSWVILSDGAGEYGEIYSNTTSKKLQISKVDKDMNGLQYCCILHGAEGRQILSLPATLTVNYVAPATPLPTQPPATPLPTQPPATPLPTQPPATPLPPTPTPVKPGAGGSSSYKPSSSSSSFVLPSSSTGRGGGGGGSEPPSSSTGKNHSGSSSFRTDIGIGGGSSSPGISVEDKRGGSSSKTGPVLSKTGPSSGGRSGPGTASTSRQLRPGSSYVMKNGVMYIVDDDPVLIGADPGEDMQGDDETEMTDEEMEYAASDLAIEGELYDMDKEKGFFDTPAGYAVIVLSGILLLALILFFLFFGVIVLGEAEEHDEVFELCALRLMKRRNSEWCVDLKNAFEDNAVVKLRIGLLFAVMFDGFDLTGTVTGSCEGEVTGQICQGMLLHRRNIRRSL